MIKSIFAAAVLSLTAISAAWAWPTSPAMPLHQQIEFVAFCEANGTPCSGEARGKFAVERGLGLGMKPH
jgi:hypothetical protein